MPIISRQKRESGEKMKFKVGDKVKIRWLRMSISAEQYNGQVGTILRCHSNDRGNYYSLDIDLRRGGIWESELELVEARKKEIKIIEEYGISKFCKEVYR